MSGAAAGDSLAEALRLSEALLAAAQNEAWEEAEAMLPVRDAAIREALTARGPADLERLTRLAELDAEILRLAEAHREALGERVRQARRGGRAHRAYTR